MRNITVNQTVRGTLCTILGGIFWGFSGTCGQYLFSQYGVSSLWVTCVRLVSGGIVLTLAALPKHRAGLLGIWLAPRDAAMLVCYGKIGRAHV